MPRPKKTAAPPAPIRVPRQLRAKLFRNGGSQAVRLPKECRLPGDEVAVTLEGGRVILEAVNKNGYSREFVELFLSGKGPDVVIADREQPPPQERDFEL